MIYQENVCFLKETCQHILCSSPSVPEGQILKILGGGGGEWKRGKIGRKLLNH